MSERSERAPYKDIWIASAVLAYVGLTQARPNYVDEVPKALQCRLVINILVTCRA